MKDLQGKVAIVTGASKGIGAGIAKGLAAAGAAVVVNYASSKEGADRVVAEIARSGGKAIAVQGDVSKAADVKRLFAETKKAFGTLDGLVYSSTKGALDNLTRGLAVELASREICVNAINPGGTETEGALATGLFDGEA